MLVAKFKIWLAIQLVKSLDVTPAHPKRPSVMDPADIDEALVCLRENTVNVLG